MTFSPGDLVEHTTRCLGVGVVKAVYPTNDPSLWDGWVVVTYEGRGDYHHLSGRLRKLDKPITIA